MLLRRHDAARHDDEWKAFLAEHDFGQLIAAGTGSDAPWVVPAHYSYDGDRTLVLHLARDNPIWRALEADPVCVFAVVDAYAYIPSYWNEPGPHGVATSYYAAVQAIGKCRAVDEPRELAGILAAQLDALQPEGGQEPSLDPDDPRYARMMKQIRGIELHISDVRAKFKFGGNKPAEQRRRIADLLAERGRGLDLAARRHLLERTPDLQ